LSFLLHTTDLLGDFVSSLLNIEECLFVVLVLFLFSLLISLIFPINLFFNVLLLDSDFLFSLYSCHFDLTLFGTQKLASNGEVLKALLSIELALVHEIK